MMGDCSISMEHTENQSNVLKKKFYNFLKTWNSKDRDKEYNPELKRNGIKLAVQLLNLRIESYHEQAENLLQRLLSLHYTAGYFVNEATVHFQARELRQTTALLLLPCCFSEEEAHAKILKLLDREDRGMSFFLGLKERCAQLSEACRIGDIATISSCLRWVEGPSLMGCHLDHIGRTPLHYAAETDKLAVVCFLLRQLRGVSTAQVEKLQKVRIERQLNRLDLMGMSALHLAAQHGHAQVVAELLKAGADCRTRDGAGRTPAHVAIYPPSRSKNALGCLLPLLKTCPSLALAEDSCGDFPLALACRTGDTGLVSTTMAAIGYGKGYAVSTKQGLKLLLYAVRSGNGSILSAVMGTQSPLLDLPALIQEYIVLKADGEVGRCPPPLFFVEAATQAKTDPFLFLLNAPGSRECLMRPWDQHYSSPLHWAVQANNEVIVRCIVALHPELCLIPDKRQLVLYPGGAGTLCTKVQDLSPLALAAFLGHRDCFNSILCEVLSRKSREANKALVGDINPLVAAIWGNSPYMVIESLRGSYAVPFDSFLNSTDYMGCCPLLEAIKKGDPLLVKHLLDSGADPNQTVPFEIVEDGATSLIQELKTMLSKQEDLKASVFNIPFLMPLSTAMLMKEKHDKEAKLFSEKLCKALTSLRELPHTAVTQLVKEPSDAAVIILSALTSLLSPTIQDKLMSLPDPVMITALKTFVWDHVKRQLSLPDAIKRLTKNGIQDMMQLDQIKKVEQLLIRAKPVSCHEPHYETLLHFTDFIQRVLECFRFKVQEESNEELIKAKTVIELDKLECDIWNAQKALVRSPIYFELPVAQAVLMMLILAVQKGDCFMKQCQSTTWNVTFGEQSNLSQHYCDRLEQCLMLVVGQEISGSEVQERKQISPNNMWSLLHLAVEAKLWLLADALLNIGADINSLLHDELPFLIKDKGWMPLCTAASEGKIDLMQRMLHAGAYPSGRKGWESPIEVSLRYGQERAVAVLSLAGANLPESFASEQSGTGFYRNAATVASSKRRYECVKSADLRLLTLNQVTSALITGPSTALKIIADKGDEAVESKRMWGPGGFMYSVFQVPNDKHRELWVAEQGPLNGVCQRTRLLKEVTEDEFDVELVGNSHVPISELTDHPMSCLVAQDRPKLLPGFFHTGYTILHEACAKGLTEAVHLLLDLDPELISQLDIQGRTPVYLASYYGHEDIVDALLFASKTKGVSFIPQECKTVADDQRSQTSLMSAVVRDAQKRLQICQREFTSMSSHFLKPVASSKSEEILFFWNTLNTLIDISCSLTQNNILSTEIEALNQNIFNCFVEESVPWYSADFVMMISQSLTQTPLATVHELMKAGCLPVLVKSETKSIPVIQGMLNDWLGSLIAVLKRFPLFQEYAHSIGLVESQTEHGTSKYVADCLLERKIKSEICFQRVSSLTRSPDQTTLSRIWSTVDAPDDINKPFLMIRVICPQDWEAFFKALDDSTNELLQSLCLEVMQLMCFLLNEKENGIRFKRSDDLVHSLLKKRDHFHFKISDSVVNQMRLEAIQNMVLPGSKVFGSVSEIEKAFKVCHQIYYYVKKSLSAKPWVPNTSIEEYANPLVGAVLSKKTAIVENIARYAGCHLHHIRCKKGRTPLQLAAIMGDFETTKALLEIPEIEVDCPSEELPGGEEWTALTYAATGCSPDSFSTGKLFPTALPRTKESIQRGNILQLLLDRGAGRRARYPVNQEGLTLLDLLCLQGHWDISRGLLLKGSSLIPQQSETQEKEIQRALCVIGLHLAAKHGHILLLHSIMAKINSELQTLNNWEWHRHPLFATLQGNEKKGFEVVTSHLEQQNDREETEQENTPPETDKNQDRHKANAKVVEQKLTTMAEKLAAARQKVQLARVPLQKPKAEKIKPDSIILRYWPLHFALKYGHVEAAAYLLDQMRKVMNSKESPHTLLCMLEPRYLSTENKESLNSHKYSCKFPKADNSLLHLACRWGANGIASILLEVPFSVSPHAKDAKERLLLLKGEVPGHPLCFAAQFGHASIIDVLAVHKPSLECIFQSLAVSLKFGQEEVAVRLLEVAALVFPDWLEKLLDQGAEEYFIMAARQGHAKVLSQILSSALFFEESKIESFYLHDANILRQAVVEAVGSGSPLTVAVLIFHCKSLGFDDEGEIEEELMCKDAWFKLKQYMRAKSLSDIFKIAQSETPNEKPTWKTMVESEPIPQRSEDNEKCPEKCPKLSFSRCLLKPKQITNSNFYFHKGADGRIKIVKTDDQSNQPASNAMTSLVSQKLEKNDGMRKLATQPQSKRMLVRKNGKVSIFSLNPK